MKMVLPILFALLVPAVSRSASAPAPVGTGGAVASADPLATAAGLEALRSGGNAVDAAVATALALAVVYPEAGNLGGGGFAVVRIGGEVAALDFRETAPAGARRDMYLDADGKPIEDASLVGPLAAGVPGSPTGLHELHRRYGRLPWTRVVAPAQRLATQGFRVSSYLHRLLGQDETRKLLLRFPESARIWLPSGEPPVPGSLLRLADLGATLDRYAAKGPEGIATGPVAAAVEKASKAHRGLLTAADLASALREIAAGPHSLNRLAGLAPPLPEPSRSAIAAEFRDAPPFPERWARDDEQLEIEAEDLRRRPAGAE